MSCSRESAGVASGAIVAVDLQVASAPNHLQSHTVHRILRETRIHTYSVEKKGLIFYRAYYPDPRIYPTSIGGEEGFHNQ